MYTYLAICLVVTLGSLTQALIVPQEVPSVLSLVYSTIPQIKKGSDSRFGFGFRLGEHADFQVLLELGPQKETEPLGMGASDSDSFRKRQVNPNDFNAISQPANEAAAGGTEGSSWLKNWANDMGSPKKKVKTVAKAKPATNRPKIEEIKTAPMISESALKQLQKLYAFAETTTDKPAEGTSSGILEIISPRNKGVQKKSKDQITAELMDVSLE